MQTDTESGSVVLWRWLKVKYDTNTEVDAMNLDTQVDLLRYKDGEDLQKHIDTLQDFFNDSASCEKDYTLSENVKKLKLYKSLPESWTLTICSFMMNSAKP
ncbi:hypothetical protein R1flu_023050 [Riccia fluitans]|uniref:Uncharacterized protein n=1 Tax=Riccia fluitans TaxID=41844 RepID=A0ABD1XRM4_9MARC